MNARNGMTPVHPGEVLRDELETLGLSANALSKALDVPVNRITAIHKGQRVVTANTVLRLALFRDDAAGLAESQKDLRASPGRDRGGPRDCRARQAPANGGVDRVPVRYERKRSPSGARPTLTTKGNILKGIPQLHLSEQRGISHGPCGLAEQPAGMCVVSYR